MKPKTTLIVIAVLALLSGLCLWLNRRASAAEAADPRVDRPLVAADTVNQAAGLRLTQEGKTVLLKKAGSQWEVASYHDLPVDFPKLADFVRTFAEAKVIRFVTADPQRIANLGFKDTDVALLDAAGRPLAEIDLGKEDSSQGGRFLRFGQEPKAYLAPVDVWPDTDSKDWADHALTPVQADDVARLSLTFPDAPPLVLSRAHKASTFTAAKTPAGRRLKLDAVTSLLDTLDGLNFTDTTAPGDPRAEAARAHARTAVLTTFAGKTITIELGREPEHEVAVKVDASRDGPLAAIGLVVGKGKVTPAQEGPLKMVGGPVVKSVPAGPVFAFVATSDADDLVNASMKKRAFEVDASAFTGLPAAPADLFEPVPPAPKPAAQTKRGK